MSTHYIDPSVLKESTQTFNLQVPEGTAGKWSEPVTISSTAVREHGEKTIVDVTFKVREESELNRMRSDKVSVWLLTEALSGKAALNQQTKISLRVLGELFKALGREVNSEMLGALAGNELVNGSVTIRLKASEQYGLQVEGFRK